MQQNHQIQNEREKPANHSLSSNQLPQQKQGSLTHTPKNSQQLISTKRDTFYSKNVMSFNDFQKHIQNLNQHSSSTQQSQTQSSRMKIEDRSQYDQNSVQNNSNNKNTYQNAHFHSTYDQYQVKSTIGNSQSIEQKQQNGSYQSHQRNTKPLPLPPSQNSISSESGPRKKIQQISNINNNNNNINNSITYSSNSNNTSNNNIKNKTFNEIQIDQNNNKLIQQRNMSGRASPLSYTAQQLQQQPQQQQLQPQQQQQQQNQQQHQYHKQQLSSIQLQDQGKTQNNIQQSQQQYQLQQQNMQITNRWLLMNQQEQPQQNGISEYSKQINNLFSEQAPKQSENNNYQEPYLSQNPYINNNSNNLNLNRISFSNTPRSKMQLQTIQSSRSNQLDFEGSQQQTQKNQVSQYTTKNTQFIKNKQQDTFQSILSQQQSHNPTPNQINNNPNKIQVGGVQQSGAYSSFPATSQFNIQIETPKEYTYNNTKSSDNLISKPGTRTINNKPLLFRHATPPDSVNRIKISNHNYMETPQCNFAESVMNKNASNQQLPVVNLKQKLLIEGMQQDDEYNYDMKGEEKPQAFYNGISKMTPSYQDRKYKKQMGGTDSENILNTSTSLIQINEERTPEINKKQKQRCKSYLNGKQSSEDFQEGVDENQELNNNLQNGTENSLSVEEHVDDSILDEKISRSMFKANPSQHIQQKVQYECITVRCIHCQQDQQLQLKKLLENMKLTYTNNNLYLNYFSRDKNEISEFNISSNDQRKLNFNISSSSSQTMGFHNNMHNISNIEYDKINNQLKDLKDHFSHETTLNSVNENALDQTKATKQINGIISANYLDLSKKSQDQQRFSSSTSNPTSNKLKINSFKLPTNEQNGDFMGSQLQQINQQLKVEINQQKEKLGQKEYELEFQQQKMDDMNSQIKSLTVKLQDIEQKYSLDQQIIQTLEIENRRLLENVTNILSLKLKLS